MGGWRFGNTINGCQAEYVLVPVWDAEKSELLTAWQKLIEERGFEDISGHGGWAAFKSGTERS